VGSHWALSLRGPDMSEDGANDGDIRSFFWRAERPNRDLRIRRDHTRGSPSRTRASFLSCSGSDDAVGPRLGLDGTAR